MAKPLRLRLLMFGLLCIGIVASLTYLVLSGEDADGVTSGLLMALVLAIKHMSDIDGVDVDANEDQPKAP